MSGKQSYGAGTGRSVLCVKTSLQRGGGGRARANQGRGLGRGANEGARIAPGRKPPERLSLKYFVSILDHPLHNPLYIIHHVVLVCHCYCYRRDDSSVSESV